jgi:hypothetical protein
VKQKFVIIFLIAAVLLTIAWSAVPLADAHERLRALPASGFGFASVDIPLTGEESSVLGHVHVIKRVYQVRDQRFVLMVIDGGADRHAVHDPLYCFRGAGWQVAARERFDVPGGSAALLKLSKENENREALFWISDDQTRHAEPMRYWWQSTLRRLTFGQSGAQPVLVIAQALEAERVDWSKLAADFPAMFML